MKIFSSSARVAPLKTLAEVGKAEKHNFREYDQKAKTRDMEKNLVLQNDRYTQNINILLDPYISAHKKKEKDPRRTYKDGLEYVEKQSKRNEEKTRAFEEKHGVLKEKMKDKDYMKKRKAMLSKQQNIGVELIFQVGGVEQGSPFEDEGQVKAFYGGVLEDLKAEYGANLEVCSAVVHLDEASPHLHIVAIPYEKSETKLGVKVKSSAFLDGKDETSSFQDWANDVMQKNLDHLRIDGVIATKEEGRGFNLSKGQLKNLSRAEKYMENELEKKVKEKAKRVVNLAGPKIQSELDQFFKREREKKQEELVKRIKVFEKQVENLEDKKRRREGEANRWERLAEEQREAFYVAVEEKNAVNKDISEMKTQLEKLELREAELVDNINKKRDEARDLGLDPGKEERTLKKQREYELEL